MAKTPNVRVDVARDFSVPQIVSPARPFLFYNGNTFAEIGRTLANALFSDLPFHRRKEASSAVAHFVTGVLDEEFMVAAIESLWQSATLAVGDRVKTLRGTAHGVVLRLLEDGRVVWRPDGAEMELMALPEALLVEQPNKNSK
jgi:hypothetical protein